MIEIIPYTRMSFPAPDIIGGVFRSPPFARYTMKNVEPEQPMAEISGVDGDWVGL